MDVIAPMKTSFNEGNIFKLIFSKVQFFVSIFITVLSAIYSTRDDKERIVKLENNVSILSQKIDVLEKQVKFSKEQLVVPTTELQPRLEKQKEESNSCESNEIIMKYKKMLSIGIPEGAVQQKMVKDGVDVKLLFPNYENSKTVSSIKTVSFSQKQTHVNHSETNPGEKQKCENKKGNLPRLQVTVAKLEEIRSCLRKTPKQPSTPDKTSMRSSFRTPVSEKIAKSPSTAKSNAEYLELALLRKFQNVVSPSVKF